MQNVQLQLSQCIAAGARRLIEWVLWCSTHVPELCYVAPSVLIVRPKHGAINDNGVGI